MNPIMSGTTNNNNPIRKNIADALPGNMALASQRTISLPSWPTQTQKPLSPSSAPPQTINAQSHSVIYSPNTPMLGSIGDILQNPDGEFRTVDYLYHPAVGIPRFDALPTPGLNPSTFLVLIAERFGPRAKLFKLTGSLFAFAGTPEESRVEVDGNSCINRDEFPNLGSAVAYRSTLFLLKGTGTGIFSDAQGSIRMTSYWSMQVDGLNRGPDWDDSRNRVRIGVWHLTLNLDAARGLQDSMYEQ